MKIQHLQIETIETQFTKLEMSVTSSSRLIERFHNSDGQFAQYKQDDYIKPVDT